MSGSDTGGSGSTPEAARGHKGGPMAPDQPTEYDAILEGLRALTREEIAERVSQTISSDEAESFRVLVQGLSLDALRVLSARALWRLQRAHVATPHGGRR